MLRMGMLWCIVLLIEMMVQMLRMRLLLLRQMVLVSQLRRRRMHRRHYDDASGVHQNVVFVADVSVRWIHVGSIVRRQDGGAAVQIGV